MNIVKYLQAQGLGSRKTCTELAARGLIRINGSTVTDPKAEISPESVAELAVGGEILPALPLPYYYILLNKPAGYETSHKPRDYPSVFSLFPPHIRATGIQAVGRLDADTTGTLLLTNDGAFNHRMTSPKHRTAKHYRAVLKHPADEAFCTSLKQGVLLHDDNETVRAADARLESPTVLLLTLTEGRYHQVKRMVAAAGNRVLSLHRTRFAQWSCDGLPPGSWRFVRPEGQDATPAA